MDSEKKQKKADGKTTNFCGNRGTKKATGNGKEIPPTRRKNEWIICRKTAAKERENRSGKVPEMKAENPDKRQAEKYKKRVAVHYCFYR